jgi:NADPH-dependent ferric siderophore reductase
MAPPNRPPPRDLTVIRTVRLTPNMQRVTLGGPGLAGFPDGRPGGYVKLRLAEADGRMVIRTYTIRAQRTDASGSEIDIDFALHAETATGHAGPATEWALNVQPGDHIEVGGPGPAKPLPPGNDYYLVAGDMTALPAISVNLEALPADARGLAVIEVMSKADQQALVHPAGVEVRWLIGPQPGAQPAALAEQARAADCTRIGLYAWAACEFSAMQHLRAYLRDECGLGPDRLYISSYWKSGLTEEAHKVIKREDAEAHS